MSELTDLLKTQERLHRKSGANALADLFMNAVKELERQHDELEQMREQRNTLAEIVDNALECAFDGCDYSGGDIQDHCLELGITIETKFDGEIHSDWTGVLDDGDEYHVCSDWFTGVMREINKEQIDE